MEQLRKSMGGYKSVPLFQLLEYSLICLFPHQQNGNRTSKEKVIIYFKFT